MDESFERAMSVRRKVLGNDYVDAVTAKATPFTAPFQQFVTRWAWGEAWLDDTLDPQARSLLTIAVVTVLGQLSEVRLHVRGALRNGCTPEQIAANPASHTGHYLAPTLGLTPVADAKQLASR